MTTRFTVTLLVEGDIPPVSLLSALREFIREKNGEVMSAFYDRSPFPSYPVVVCSIGCGAECSVEDPQPTCPDCGEPNLPRLAVDCPLCGEVLWGDLPDEDPMGEVYRGHLEEEHAEDVLDRFLGVHDGDGS